MSSYKALETAYNTRDAGTFMSLLFPEEWAPIRARIIESGVTMSNDMVPWAPRWAHFEGRLPCRWLHVSIPCSTSRSCQSGLEIVSILRPSQQITFPCWRAIGRRLTTTGSS